MSCHRHRRRHCSTGRHFQIAACARTSTDDPCCNGTASCCSRVRTTPLQCRFEDWNAKETEFLNETQLITSKPVVYLLNLSEKNYVAKKGKWLKPVFEWVQVRYYGTCCCASLTTA